MRLWAEDIKGNTLELLLTFPMRIREVTLGKFFASLTFYIVALLATLPIPIMILVLGNPDMGPIVTGYIGALLAGSFFLALGIFVSGFCKDQIVAFVLSMMFCFGFFLLGTDFAVGSIDGWLPGLGTFLRSVLGMSQHFISFERGIIDNRDVVYFVIGAVIFLILNSYWFEGRLRPRSRTIFALACLISTGIFILINLIFVDLPIGRYDLTEDKIHTVSSSSKHILQNLKAPVTVKLFISPPDKMPTEFKSLERDIRDKLEEFRIATKGNFEYKVFHMEAANVTDKKSDEETLVESIQKKGILPFQVQSIEADEVGVKLIYSAISIAYKEKPEEVMPQITPRSISRLEYDMMSKIYKMTLDKEPRVALFAPYQERPVEPGLRDAMKAYQNMDKIIEDDYEIIPKALELEGYKVSRIRLTRDDLIPEGTDTLIVIEPSRLNDRQRYEINRFLVNGGSVFIAAQQYDFNYSLEAGGLQVVLIDKQPQINPLLNTWGLGLDEDILMDKEHDVITVTGTQSMGGVSMAVSYPVKLPIQIRVLPEQMNKDVSITSNLSSVLYLWGNAIKIDKDRLKKQDLSYQLLFSSSNNSWKKVFASQKGMQVLNDRDFIMPAPEERQGFPLAVLVEGCFADAYSGKAVPTWPVEEGEGVEGQESYEAPQAQEHATITSSRGSLILVGCSIMFNKQAIGQAGHFNFLLNSVDSITLGEDLIKIRSKGPRDRALRSLSANAKAGWRIFTTFFVPVILSIGGALRLFTRRRLKWSLA
jgi:gliding-associated putative ABC transporter substrate-binding component GldG